VYKCTKNNYRVSEELAAFFFRVSSTCEEVSKVPTGGTTQFQCQSVGKLC
jgi:hypothetical protein